MWEQIAIDLRNTIRHEIEHLMQSGLMLRKEKKNLLIIEKERN